MDPAIGGRPCYPPPLGMVVANSPGMIHISIENRETIRAGLGLEKSYRGEDCLQRKISLASDQLESLSPGIGTGTLPSR